MKSSAASAHRQHVGRHHVLHEAGYAHLRQGLSAGYLPIAAVMMSEKIYAALVKRIEKIGVFAHGFTYSGHPVTSAVALET